MFILSCNGIQVNVPSEMAEVINYVAQSLVVAQCSPCTIDEYENKQDGTKPFHNHVGKYVPTLH